MKKTKIILPLVAFVLALTGAFLSRNSQAAAMVSPDYIYNTSGQCVQLPFGTCNNSPFGAICTFNPGTGYTEVYDHKFGVACADVLRHSLNDGMLN